VNYYLKSKDDVRKNWHSYRELIGLACAKDTTEQLTAAGVYSTLLNGEAQLGVIESDSGALMGAFVFEVLPVADGAALYITALACKEFIADLRGFDEYLQFLCVGYKCKSIIMTSRPGFQKILSKLGYAKRAVVLKKEL